MPKASLLIVGSEMLDPQRPDANGPLARERLAELGIALSQLVRVEDREDAIAAALRGALETSDVVIASGGLGPTGDDLTRQGVARALGRGVTLDEPWLAELTRRVEARGRPLTEAERRQALIVEGAEPIPNPRGLACGSFLEAGGKVIALLPGVVPEFAGMLEEYVLPRLAARFPDRPEVRVVRAVVAGLPEVQAEPVLGPWYERPGVAVSVLPVLGVLRITLALTDPPAGPLDPLEGEARRNLSTGLAGHLVSLDGTSLEQRIGQMLLAKGWTLAAAESCSGGRAAHKIVSVPGASRYFLGGVEAYADEAKRDLLGVPAELIARHGAVSEEVVLAMVRGARRRFGASCAIAITGVAGPDGGTPDKPVGLVHVAAATPEAESARRIHFPLDRASVMELSANYALYALWRLLGGPTGA
jgi:nicotinamide-nucleotide amidase